MPITFWPGQLTRRAQFYQQFAQLTSAGVRVIESLEMIRRGPPSLSYRRPLGHLLERLKQGCTLTESLRSLGRWLPVFDLALISAGEHSGRLDAVCRLLANYYEDKARLLRQMIADLMYPLFIFHFAIFLFPAINLFSGGGSWVGYLLKTFGVLIPIYLLVFLLVYAAQGRHGQGWRSFMEAMLRPVPVLGKARHFLSLSRLAAALEALINAGVTIIEAWDMAAAASGSPAIQRAVQRWKPLVQEGMMPGEAVRNSSLFPEMFSNFYQSGEVSGQLDDSLRRLHVYYEEEAVRRMRFLAQWLPRMIYFGIAFYIAYRVVMFYSNYFDQLNQIMK
jgi:type II secretory pathway component PulF